MFFTFALYLSFLVRGPHLRYEPSQPPIEPVRCPVHMPPQQSYEYRNWR